MSATEPYALPAHENAVKRLRGRRSRQLWPWDTDPWTLTLKADGKYYGRGTCDMKAFYAIALAMLPQILKGPTQEADPSTELRRRRSRLHRRPFARRPHGEQCPTARHHHRRADMMTVVHAQGAQICTSPSSPASRRIPRYPSRRPAPSTSPASSCITSTMQDELEAAPPKNSECSAGSRDLQCRHHRRRHRRQHPGARVRGAVGLPRTARRRSTRSAASAKWLKEELLPNMKAKHPAASIDTMLRSSTTAFSPHGNEDAKTLARSWSGSNTGGQRGLRHRGRIFKKAPSSACRPWCVVRATSPRPTNPMNSCSPPRSTPARRS